MMPWLDRSPVRSAVFRPIYKKLFWLLVIDLLRAGLYRRQAPLGRRLCVLVGQLATLFYFAFFLVILPFLPRIEKPCRCRTVFRKPCSRKILRYRLCRTSCFVFCLWSQA